MVWKAKSKQVRLGGLVAVMLATHAHAWAAAPALKAPLVATSGAKLVAPPPTVIGTVTPKPASAAPATATATATAQPVSPPPASGPDFVGPTYFRQAKVKVYTGNDNKEASSTVWATLYINGGAPDDNGGLNPDRLQELTAVRLGNSVELRPNSLTESVMETAPGAAVRMFEYIQANTWGEADRRSLALCQQYGLRLEIKYDPNFALDAWEIKRVDLEVDFGSWEGWVLNYGGGQSAWRFLQKAAPGYPRTITFSRSARLSDGNRRLVLVTDGFFFPK